MRRYVFAGNWKMNKTVSEAVALARALREGLEKEPTPHEVVVMPPFTALAEVGKALKGSPIVMGAQNMHWEREGAFTGEVSCCCESDYPRCRAGTSLISSRRTASASSELPIWNPPQRRYSLS